MPEGLGLPRQGLAETVAGERLGLGAAAGCQAHKGAVDSGPLHDLGHDRRAPPAADLGPAAIPDLELGAVGQGHGGARPARQAVFPSPVHPQTFLGWMVSRRVFAARADLVSRRNSPLVSLAQRTPCGTLALCCS